MLTFRCGFPAGGFFGRIRFVRFFRRCALRGRDLDVQFRRHIVVKLDLDFLLAALLDGFVEQHGMLGQLDIAKFLDQSVVDILCRDGSKSLAGLACLKSD